MFSLLKNIIHCASKKSFPIGTVFLIFIFSCGPARHLEEDEYLLTKVKIEFQNNKKHEEELYSLSKQKPNRKFLGLFKIYLGVYNLFFHKEESKIKESVGEPPVIYDSSLSMHSADLMKKYLQNRGYYENKVEVKSRKGKKNVKLIYRIDKGERYYISKLADKFSDSRIESIFFRDTTDERYLEVGVPFDAELLAKERDRIELKLKNEGYFNFIKEYVVFKVDTFMKRNEAEVTMEIKDPAKNLGQSKEAKSSKHKVYTISKVIVRTDHALTGSQEEPVDTTMVDSIYFVDFKSDRFKKKRFASLVAIRTGQLYQLKKQEQTYRNFSSLGLFNQVSIHYEVDYSVSDTALIAYIDLNPRMQQSYSLESEGTNNGGNLGINATVNYRNINTFRGAEVLSIGLSGGLEAQRILTDDDEREIASGALGFNTLEFGPNVSLEVPRFVLPFGSTQFSPKNNPRTSFNASFNFQERPDYTRNVTKTYIAYSWNQSERVSHILQPFDLSFAKIDLSTAFDNLLDEIQNPFLRNSYTDNLILALKYSYIYNDQNISNSAHNNFFRLNLESAGNLLSLATDGFNGSRNEDGSFNIANIRYAQYFKADFDFRHYQMIDINQLVYRFAAGLGLPYGNSSAMPFEKSFYGGGANSNRAWRARDLGPGTLPDSVPQNIDQIGNMKIEWNIEFRFPVSGILEGAAFLDAGNIWNFDQEDSREETQFELGELWDGTAIGMGLGFRLNFSFFILRLDFAAPFKDPASDDPTAFDFQLDRTNLNLGNGYPF